MKLIQYANQQGISYSTARRLVAKGKPSGAIKRHLARSSLRRRVSRKACQSES